MSQLSDLFDNTTDMPAADTVIISSGNENATTDYQYIVRRPEEYENDFMVEVRASSLRKIRNIIVPAKNQKFSFHELFLSISFLCLGATISALSTGILLDSLEGRLLYILCPVISTGTLVSYIFIKKSNLQNLSNFATLVEENLVDPDKTV